MTKVSENNCDVRQTLMPLKEALAELEAIAIPVATTELVTLKEALGRVLAEDIISQINVPPADNSAMDGYAVRASDLSKDGKTTFIVSQRICAGEMGTALTAGKVARIFTGAPIPEGADEHLSSRHHRTF